MNLYDTKLLQELLDYGSEKDREYLALKLIDYIINALEMGRMPWQPKYMTSTTLSLLKLVVIAEWHLVFI